ncbi:MAG TPA: hypothetical protein VIY52_34165 [Streptosporangiaceae bacterium]
MGELIGYAGCSAVLQDLTAWREAVAALGVPAAGPRMEPAPGPRPGTASR